MPPAPLVYLASPYTKGDPAVNTGFQCRMFDELLNDGVVTPYAPLWSHFQHTFYPRPYADWIAYDNAMIDSGVFAACLRLNATHAGIGYRVDESSGADAEVARFQKQGKPVFYDKLSLYDWVKRPKTVVLCEPDVFRQLRADAHAALTPSPARSRR